MRLIDADMLIEKIEKIALEAEQQVHGRRSGKTLAKGILFGLGAARKIILDRPTAYDLDKVMEQLKEVSYERYGNDGGMGGELVVNLDDVVDIVKGSGVDG